VADPPARAPARTGRRLRRAALGLGVAAAGAVAVVATERAVARRLRGRPDPESGEVLGTLPPDDLGTVTSFDGTPIAVRAAGPEGAPTVVFAHGITLDMTSWYYQWRGLSDRYRCVVFDQRAHGRSGEPASGDYSVLAMGRDLRAVLDHVSPKGPVALVGHSMGGMAIAALAHHHPEEFGDRVAGVVLADTGVSDFLKEVFGGLGARAGRVLRQVGNRYRTRLDRAERLRERVRRSGTDLALLTVWATNFGPGASPTQVEYISRLAQDAPVEVWIHTLQDIMELDLRHTLGHIRCPALVVVGDRDLLTPKTSAQALRDALPQARAVVITGAGHIAMMERHRVFNEILTEFLEETLPRRRSRRRAAAKR
jgi:pimeloyl-ACP methyl ester carboxylesterase